MKYPIYLFIIFILLSLANYYVPFKIEIDYKIFLTITTFLFAILAGFFISRQGSRYSAIRDALTKFDGNMSFVYRVSGHFGEAQKEVGEILKRHYTPILEQRMWYYPFTHKTTTLTDLHALCHKIAENKSLLSLQSTVLAQMIVAFRECQTLRKNMIALYEERVPRLQWLLINFLVVILFINLSAIPSYSEFLISVFKGVFGTILIFVLIFLQKLDQLEFFENAIGENSAQDVLNIIEGKK
ncbi:MAG: hypothetical protein DDT32_02213 [Syntrophomonadaceae bacterium]|nr:hypothetical protein [Bacillota bacterium]